MAVIGYVTQDKNGSFQGPLNAQHPRRDRHRRQRQRSNDTQPHYRLLSVDVEIGAGWHRRAETSGRDYVSLSLAAPEFSPRRLYAI